MPLVVAASVLLAAAALAQGSGRWTTGSANPSARTEIAAAAVSGKIYVVGGFQSERMTRDIPSLYRPPGSFRGSPLQMRHSKTSARIAYFLHNCDFL
jgi:hypothetical protein